MDNTQCTEQFIPAEWIVGKYELYKTMTQTTYITKTGLPCTILDIDNYFLEVIILFDSDELRNALYRLEFSPEIEMEEVEAILDSIPIKSNGVPTN